MRFWLKAWWSMRAILCIPSTLTFFLGAMGSHCLASSREVHGLTCSFYGPFWWLWGTSWEEDESRGQLTSRIEMAKMRVASGGQDREKRTFSEVKWTGLWESKEAEIYVTQSFSLYNRWNCPSRCGISCGRTDIGFEIPGGKRSKIYFGKMWILIWGIYFRISHHLYFQSWHNSHTTVQVMRLYYSFVRVSSHGFLRC